MIALKSLEAQFESPIEIRTDCKHLLLVWPDVEGRDVNAILQGDFVKVTIDTSAISYGLLFSNSFADF